MTEHTLFVPSGADAQDSSDYKKTTIGFVVDKPGNNQVKLVTFGEKKENDGTN